MCSGCRHVGGCPGDTVGGATGDLGDLVALEAMDKRWFPVHCGRTIALLAVVVVTPCIHLEPDYEWFLILLA